MPENRRKYLRIPVECESSQATVAGKVVQVSVLDQSIEGMRIGNVHLDRLNRGDPIEVEIDGEVVLGQAQSVMRVDERTYEVGIRRADAGVAPVEDTHPLLVSFINLQQRWICCRIVEDVDPTHVRIRLLDGKEFKVDRETLFQLTESERRKMLGESPEFYGAVEFYRLLLPGSKFESVDDVIGHEFA